MEEQTRSRPELVNQAIVDLMTAEATFEQAQLQLSIARERAQLAVDGSTQYEPILVQTLTFNGGVKPGTPKEEFEATQAVRKKLRAAKKKKPGPKPKAPKPEASSYTPRPGSHAANLLGYVAKKPRSIVEITGKLGVTAAHAYTICANLTKKGLLQHTDKGYAIT